MARVLWLSDGGCTTGFGHVTHHIGERLVRDYGHDIHCLATNHRGDYFPSILEPERPSYIKLYNPTQLDPKDTYGTSRFVELLGELGETRPGLDCVVVLNDPYILLQFLYENPYDPKKYLLQYRPILYYVPVDGINLPPQWMELIPRITNTVAMSRWGQKFYQPSRLVYHGVDPEQYWPVAEKPIKLSTGEVLRTKKDAKRAFGFNPDSFVVGRIDSNSGRKDYPSLVKALAPVMAKHKDIEVWFHTQASQMQHGVNLGVLWSRFPDVDPERIKTPDLYSRFIGWPTEDMNGLFNAFDIFVSTSRGEGFGLSLAQSLACGVPVVAQNVSAIPEVVGPGGVLIDPIDRLITVPAGHDMWLSDIEAFSREIEHLYEARGVIRKLGEAGKEHVRKSFSWDVAAARFHKYITGLASGSTDTSEARDAVQQHERAS